MLLPFLCVVLQQTADGLQWPIDYALALSQCGHSRLLNKQSGMTSFETDHLVLCTESGGVKNNVLWVKISFEYILY